ncbi:MAG: hypothetical protein ABW092_11745 [Candidatus Thiodiazotropha sp.]
MEDRYVLEQRAGGIVVFIMPEKMNYLSILLLLLPFTNISAEERYYILKIEISKQYADYFSLDNMGRKGDGIFTRGSLNGLVKEFPVRFAKAVVNDDRSKTLIFDIPLGITGIHQGAYAKALLSLSEGHSIVDASALLRKGFFNKPAVIITDGKEFVTTEEITLLEKYPENRYIAKIDFSKKMCIISDPEKYQTEDKKLSFYPADICMQQKYYNNQVWVEGSVLLESVK